MCSRTMASRRDRSSESMGRTYLAGCNGIGAIRLQRCHIRVWRSRPRGLTLSHMTKPRTSAEAEAHVRRLLEANDMPQPDEVQHRPAELVLLYHEQKVAFTFE